jgi:hypothetical protein
MNVAILSPAAFVPNSGQTGVPYATPPGRAVLEEETWTANC